MVSLWLFSILLGIICPFTVVFGSLCLTVVCVDIGFVGDVDGASIYGRKEMFVFSFVKVFAEARVGKWEDERFCLKAQNPIIKVLVRNYYLAFDLPAGL